MRIGNDIGYLTEELHNTARQRLTELSASFGKLAKSFSQLRSVKKELDGEDLNRVFEELSSGLCLGCEKCNICWSQRFDESYNRTRELLKQAAQKGEVTLEEVSKDFLEHCIRTTDFIREVNRSISVAKLKLAWNNRLEDSREVVAGQFDEMSRIVEEFSDKLYDSGKIVDMQKRKVYSMLRSHRIRVKRLLVLERENRGIQLHMRAKCTGGRCITTKEAAILLSIVLECRLVPREDAKNVIGKDYADYVFCEDANFQVLTGVARASKTRGELSGDNFSFLYPESGDLIMMLSDGMGTGRKACEESERVIELLEQFLEAGFREESAVKMINSVLVLRPDQTIFSTMDLCVVNLCTGTCEFVKVGAATTFIKRDGIVEMVSSSTLPAGMIRRADYEIKCKKLYDGDFVIMVSDGVLESAKQEEKEEYFKKVIEQIKSVSPQEIANAVLTAALELHEYQPIDDMTVLVCGIWKK